MRSEQLDRGCLLVNNEHRSLLRHNGIATAEDLWDLSGEPVKNVLRERGTERVFLRPERDGEEPVEAYLKRYRSTPLRERIKSAFSLKFKTYDAFHEWGAMVLMHDRGVPTVTPLAAGKTARGSCSLTLGIRHYRRASALFESFAAADRDRRRELIAKIADLAGRLHGANLAHQDFYLVHVFVLGENEPEVFLIDPQRVVSGNPIGRRWIVKDLGQLLFSARPLVSNTDLLRFWRIYVRLVGENFRNVRLIKAIFRKSKRIARRDAARRNERDG